MKIKKFNEYHQINEWGEVFFQLSLGFALMKIMYNFLKRGNIVGKLKNKNLEVLSEFISKWKDKKALIGNVIDNDKEGQIIYEYGASDNLVVFHINKETKTLTFRWEFTQPIFPYWKFANDDEITMNLNNDEYLQVLDIFDKLKKEDYKTDTFDKGVKVKNARLL